MSQIECLTVTVFMEDGWSLRTWDSMGILKREIGYYRALSDLGIRINLICYGERELNDVPALVGDIRVHYNQLRLPQKTYRRRIHQLHARTLLQSQLLATHNTHAMLATMRAHWAWRLPFVMRMGYSWSESAREWPGSSGAYIQDALKYERQAFSDAVQIIATNNHLAEIAHELTSGSAEKVSVIPRFVDCDLFRPLPLQKRYDLIYIGRLAGVKNLEATLEAVKRAGATIAIIGSGTPNIDRQSIDNVYENRLQARFGNMNGRAHWLGLVPNEDLPRYINQAKALVLCSLSEGHGRSMIEALACGVPVIGSKVGGIQSVLRHGETGYLCETDADSITAAIESVLSQPRLLEEMGTNARQYALDTFSLPAVARQEYELLLDVARRNPVESAAKRIAQYILRKR